MTKVGSGTRWDAHHETPLCNLQGKTYIESTLDDVGEMNVVVFDDNGDTQCKKKSTKEMRLTGHEWMATSEVSIFLAKACEVTKLTEGVNSVSLDMYVPLIKNLDKFLSDFLDAEDNTIYLVPVQPEYGSTELRYIERERGAFTSECVAFVKVLESQIYKRLIQMGFPKCALVALKLNPTIKDKLSFLSEFENSQADMAMGASLARARAMLGIEEGLTEMAQAATPIEEVVIEEELGAASVEGLSEEEQAAVAVVEEATGVSDSLLCVSGNVLVATAAQVEWLSETAIWNRDRRFDSKSGRAAKISKARSSRPSSTSWYSVQTL